MSGCSVRPWVEGQPVAGRDHAYIECNIFGRAIVGERYKYVTEIIPTLGEEFIANPDASRLRIEQLFDLHDDPGETRNIASDPDQTERLTSLRNQLLATEAGLNRRPLCAEHSRNILKSGDIHEQVFVKRIAGIFSRVFPHIHSTSSP